jgi:hypothetical protein
MLYFCTHNIIDATVSMLAASKAHGITNTEREDYETSPLLASKVTGVEPDDETLMTCEVLWKPSRSNS